MQKNEISILLNIAYNAILGSILRLCLSISSDFISNYYLIILIENLPNISGSIVMGALSKKKPVFENYNVMFLYLGATTGFCGSLTSFSSWMLEFSQELFTIEELYNLIEMAITLTVFILCFKFGQLIITIGDKISPAVDEKFHCHSDVTKNGHEEPSYYIILNIINLFAITTIFMLMPQLVTTSVKFLNSSYFIFLYSIFSIAGATFRYFLGKWANNPNRKLFPQFGTFLANIIACIIIPLPALLLTTHPTLASLSIGSHKSDYLGFLIISIQFGFCGCLSTISTFVSEICNLKLHQSIIYVLVSVILAHLIVFFIIYFILLIR